MRYFYLFIFVIIGHFSFSQNYFTLRGYVSDESNTVLESASIRVFNLGIGTKTNAKGQYELRLVEGLNRLMVSSLGYKSETFEIVMNKDSVKNFILNIDQKSLDEVIVKVKKRDYSYEVIKNVIENKSKILNQYINYQCDTYIKAVEELQYKVKFDSLKKIDSLPKINLFECKLIRHETADGKQKEEKIAVKKIGEQLSLFYKSVTDGEFNLYKNYQKIVKIGDNQIVSPVSDLAFLNYKFKLEKYFYEGKEKIYLIKVIPRDLGNAMYEGEIEVIEDEWVIRKADLSLTKRGLLNYDAFTIHQRFSKIDNRWMPDSTVYEWKIKEKSVKKTGKTLVIQSNFKFDLALPSKFFGDEIGLTQSEAYKKDSTYWEQIRPIPLSKTEVKNIKDKEKLDALMSSKTYLDSIDKAFNRITFGKLAYQGFGHTNRSKKIQWSFNPVVAAVNPFGIGGLRLRYGVGFYKKYENKRTFSLNSDVSYGILNKDIKGGIQGNYFYDPIKQASFDFTAGSDFGIVNGNATIADILKRQNFYQSRYLSLGHRREVLNGLYVYASSRVEFRQDLSKFKFSKLGDKVNKLVNTNPDGSTIENIDELLKPTTFLNSTILKTYLGLEYTPHQLYLREPDQKIILGSKFPTFFGQLLFSVPTGKQDIGKYTYFSFGAKQTFNIGLAGTSEYNINASKFLKSSNLAPMDSIYIRGNDSRLFFRPMYGFQYIPKTFTLTDWKVEGHYVHQFNGALTSKIPFFNKTGIKEMAGGGLLYIPSLNYRYAEMFTGLNKTLKLGRLHWRLGAYYILANGNKFGTSSGFKFSIESYNPFRNTWSF